jgi:hypothetical protein
MFACLYNRKTKKNATQRAEEINSESATKPNHQTHSNKAMKKLLAITSAIADRWLSAMNHKIAIVGMLAGSIVAAGATNYSTTTVGTVNGNNLAFTEATGNSDSCTTFTNNLANAYVANSGGELFA